MHPGSWGTSRDPEVTGWGARVGVPLLLHGPQCCCFSIKLELKETDCVVSEVPLPTVPRPLASRRCWTLSCPQGFSLVTIWEGLPWLTLSLARV